MILTTLGFRAAPSPAPEGCGEGMAGVPNVCDRFAAIPAFPRKRGKES